jgi:hypothetical protein
MNFPLSPDLICLLADQDDPRRYDMAPLGTTAIIKLPVLELVLTAQMILCKRFGAGFELSCVDKVY